MAAEGTRAFTIKQYHVDPSKLQIAGPDGVSSISASQMTVLVQLADCSQQFVSPERLLKNTGSSGQTSSADLDVMVKQVLKILGEHPEETGLIVQSENGDYKLCSSVVFENEKMSEVSSVPATEPDVEFDNFVQALSDDDEEKQARQSADEELTPPASETGWFEALKRRRVFRAMGAYAVASWLIMQITALLVGAFPAIPASATGLVTIALLVGFPIALVLAWLIQLTPSGPKLDVKPGAGSGSVRDQLIHLIDVVVIGILLVVVAILAYDRDVSNNSVGVSIAVLAFTNPNELEEDRYLGVGISDNIRTRLTSVEKLSVAAPPSRELQPDQNLSVKAIGERLGVDYVLHGSERRVNGRVQLDVHLVKVSTGFSKWGKSYDVSLEDMLTVNNNISLYVASEMEVILTHELRESLAGNPTDVPAAYEAYLEGRSYLELPRTNLTIAKAILFLKEAVTKDPAFALAYAGQCEAFTAMYLDSADVRAVDLAEGNCRTALELDDTLSPVHVAMGNVLLNSGRLAEADEAFREAFKLDENSLGAITGLGDVYNAHGDLSSAEAQYRLAIDKLPNNWNGYNRLGHFLLARGRYEEAATNYRHVLAFMPDNVNAYNNLGAAYFYLGDFVQAAENYRRSLQLEPDEASYSNTGSTYYYARDFSNAVAMYKKAQALSPKDYRVWGNLADALRFIDGEFEQARDMYNKAIELAKAQLAVSPDDIQIKSNLAYYLANLGEKEEARALLEQIERTPNLNPQLQYTMALSFRLIGEVTRSNQALSEARIQGYPQVVIEATPEFAKDALVENYLKSVNAWRSSDE